MKRKQKVLCIAIFSLGMFLLSPRLQSIDTIPRGHRPQIDGIISSGEWVDAHIQTVELESVDNTQKKATRFYKHTNEMLYFALIVEGRSEEIFLWLGDDDSQAWQTGSDIKRMLKLQDYQGEDYYYEAFQVMKKDQQQDIVGKGIYDESTDETTVELEIPFHSTDENDYSIEYEKMFTILYGSIHISSPEKEFQKKEEVIILRQEIEHEDLDLCSCVDVKVTVRYIEHYWWDLFGVFGYRYYSYDVPPNFLAKGGKNLASINATVSIKEITCCKTWRDMDEIKGVTATITANTRVGKKTNSASVFRKMQLSTTQEWFNDSVSMTNLSIGFTNYIKPGTCTVKVIVQGKPCYSMSFVIW